jgi:lantibiotic modifying enzyme
MYITITPAGAAQLVRLTTHGLNKDGVRFRLKIAHNPASYDRLDTAVLYLSPEDFQQALPILKGIWNAVKAHLRARTPALTKPIAFGVAVAEASGDDSFGRHRCELVAESIVRSFDAGVTALHERMAILEDTFKENNIALDRPYCSVQQHDDAFWGRLDHIATTYGVYDQHDEASTRHASNWNEKAMADALQVAKVVGHQLCDAAIWDANLCTWIRRSGALRDSNIPLDLYVYRNIGPELDKGACGIALFLASLWTATRERVFLDTAIAATRPEGLRLATEERSLGPGLYQGVTGIALVLAYVGVLAREEQHLSMAREIAYSIAANFPASSGMDNIESEAGVITGLLALSARLDDSSLVAAAARIAGHLIERCSCLISQGGHLSEGDAFSASEIALALIELYAVTGSLPYLRGVEKVFEWEGVWDYESGLGWRRGLAGRALARLRWCQVHRSEQAVTAAQDALDCLRTAVASALHGDAVLDSTLVDGGLPGAVEVLLFAQEVFPGDIQSQDISDRALTSGLAKDPPSAWDWSAIPADPGLMCGMSGWGYIYLRRACSTVPSPLLLGRLG